MDDSLNKVEKNVPTLLKYVLMIPKFLNLLWSLYKDGRVPRYLKWTLIGVITYVLMPWDILPDFIPVLGHSDDVIIILLTILEFLKLCPREVVLEHWKTAIGETTDVKTYVDTAIESIKPHVSYRFNFIVANLGKIFTQYEKLKGEETCLSCEKSKIIKA